MSLPAWNSNSSYNKYTDTYFKGAVDVSGGNIINRTGNLNLVTGGIIAGSNTITNEALGYIKNISSDIQTQVTNLTTSLTSFITSNTTKLTNITYNPTSTYTDMYNVYIANDLSCNATVRFNNTLTIYGNLSVNSQSIKPTELGYLSGLSGNVKSAIDTINTNIFGIGGGSGGYTNIQKLYAYLDLSCNSNATFAATTTINGTLSISSTGSILCNSVTILPTKLSYLANVTSDIQLQFDSINQVTSNDQTWSGIKTFNSPPVMSGASITSRTIPDTAFLSTFVKTTTAQTIGGVKTFSTAPILSGASITTGTIPDTAFLSTFVKTTTAQTIGGVKTFTGTTNINNLVLKGPITLADPAVIPTQSSQLGYYIETIVKPVNFYVSSIPVDVCYIDLYQGTWIVKICYSMYYTGPNSVTSCSVSTISNQHAQNTSQFGIFYNTHYFETGLRNVTKQYSITFTNTSAQRYYFVMSCTDADNVKIAYMDATRIG
jgi:hypothetical protein